MLVEGGGSNRRENMALVQRQMGIKIRKLQTPTDKFSDNKQIAKQWKRREPRIFKIFSQITEAKYGDGDVQTDDFPNDLPGASMKGVMGRKKKEKPRKKKGRGEYICENLVESGTYYRHHIHACVITWPASAHPIEGKTRPW